MKNLAIFLIIILCLASTCWFVARVDVTRDDVVTWQMLIPTVIAFLLILCFAPWVFGLPFVIGLFILFGVILPMYIFGFFIVVGWIVIDWLGGPKLQSHETLLQYSFGATVFFWIWWLVREKMWEKEKAKSTTNSKLISS